MQTFNEYQASATKVPVSLRNNRDRIDLPVMGLQEQSGKIGALLAETTASGRFILTSEQNVELKDSLSEILWYVALLSDEAKIPMQELATHSISQIQMRFDGFDPDRR